MGVTPKPPYLVIHGSPALRGMTLCKPHEAESSAASAFLALLFCSVSVLFYGYFGCRGGVNPPAALYEIGPFPLATSFPGTNTHL